MNISFNGWQDKSREMRALIARDVIDIMLYYFHNEALFLHDLQILNIHTVNCVYADEDPCTHYDRSRICLNVEGPFWCQFVHQLSHELCHCSTSRRSFPPKIKWFDEFICCCSSYLAETVIANNSEDRYDYMFPNRTAQVFSDYLTMKVSEHVYEVDSTQDFFNLNRKSYETNANLIKAHDVYVRKFFESLDGDFSGLTFVGKMYLVEVENDITIELFLEKLLALCVDKERTIIYQICDLFGISMRKMKDSKIEWVGEIPETWRLERLQWHLDEINAGNNPIQTENILSLTNKLGVVPYEEKGNQGNKSKENIYEYKLAYPNTIVANSMNILIGSVGLCEYFGCVSPVYYVFRAKKDSNIKYLHYVFQTAGFQRELRKYANGILEIRLRVSASDILKRPIPYPPLEEQQRIVDFLDGERERIDGLKADIETQIETLEKYKRSIITESVTHGLDPAAPMKESQVWYGQIPQGWTAIKGKYIFTQRNERGNHIELRLLSPTQKYGVIPQDLYEELSGMSAVKLNDNTNFTMLKTIHKGDYCISLRSFQGGFEYSEYEGVVSPAYQVFYPIVPICSGYYKYLFKEAGFIDVMNSYTISLRDGKNIAFDDFGNTYIPVPPLSEQQAIADFLDEKCAQIAELISLKQSQIETLETYKKSLIFEYVTGKKEVV